MLKYVVSILIGLSFFYQATSQTIEVNSEPMAASFITDLQSKEGRTPNLTGSFSNIKLDMLISDKIIFYKKGYYTQVLKIEDSKKLQYTIKLTPYTNAYAGKVTNKIVVKDITVSAKAPIAEDLNPYYTNSVEVGVNSAIPSSSLTIYQTLKNDGIRAYPNTGNVIDSLRFSVSMDVKHIWILPSAALVNINWSLYDNYQKRTVYSFETTGASHGSDVKNRLLECMAEATKNFSHDQKIQKYLLLNTFTDSTSSGAQMEEIMISKILAKEGLSHSEIVKNAIKSTVTIKTESGHGSGFIISEDGFIITNKHVIDGNKQIEVIFSNGFILYPKIIQQNEMPDLALLKVEGHGFLPLPFSTSGETETGDEIIVIGTPKDILLGQTVTKGIISGKREFEGNIYLQTDASINPGNSGGPILNMKGEVIGVATYKNIKAEGISFGITVTDVLKYLNIVLK